MANDPRREGVTGVEPISIVDFKDGLNLKSTIHFNIRTTLQVDLVHTAKRAKKAGIATELYIKLAQAGFTVISDNEQWIGGMQLWKKLAQTTAARTDVKVFLLKNDKQELYTGNNIPDDQIWSSGDEHKHSLLMIKKV